MAFALRVFSGRGRRKATNKALAQAALWLNKEGPPTAVGLQCLFSERGRHRRENQQGDDLTGCRLDPRWAFPVGSSCASCDKRLCTSVSAALNMLERQSGNTFVLITQGSCLSIPSVPQPVNHFTAGGADPPTSEQLGHLCYLIVLRGSPVHVDPLRAASLGANSRSPPVVNPKLPQACRAVKAQERNL